jgi:hypothetical protein
MYSIILIAHSWLRWLALIMGVAATLALMTSKRADAGSRPARLVVSFMGALDLQMLLGLVLYFVLSPLTTELMPRLGEAMRDPQLRFWAVDHISVMFVAVIVVHVGRVLARKAQTPDSERLRLLTCVAFATFLIILGTPWPGLPSGRPLFRF